MSRSRNSLPIIGITVGDPKGIGPEVTLKALRSSSILKICQPIVFGDPAYFDWKKASRLTPKECGKISGYFIECAAHAAMTGQIDAMVTGPISKEHLQTAGYPYPGHTEFLAALSGTKDFRMMFSSPSLRVVLVTIHEALKNVPKLLTEPLVRQTIRMTYDHLKSWFGIARPRIAVCGLNPHASEGGIFGNEEERSILPAIRNLNRKNIPVTGPYPPDTIFQRAVRGEFDAVVAMYHDQGLIPLKLLHFDEAVNITLGIPFIRTSVDHGTAFDIAGKGIANPASMMAAIHLAVALASRRKQT